MDHPGAPDGTARAEPMSKSCIVSVPQPKEGTETLGAYVTHHLTPFPLESHVFASLNHRIQLVVATAPDRGWIVSEGEIVMFELTP